MGKGVGRLRGSTVVIPGVGGAGGARKAPPLDPGTPMVLRTGDAAAEPALKPCAWYIALLALLLLVEAEAATDATPPPGAAEKNGCGATTPEASTEGAGLAGSFRTIARRCGGRRGGSFAYSSSSGIARP